MNIIFSPEFAGTIFAKSPDGKNVMMDTVVANTIGLVNLLELRLGLHYEEISANERLAHYYAAVCQYMDKHPKNVMAESFALAGLSTAKAMLRWRDELRSSDWGFTTPQKSERLDVLIGVEEFFHKKCGLDLTQRICSLIRQISEQQIDCHDITITTTIYAQFAKPSEQSLFHILSKQGALIKTLDEAADVGDNLSKIRQLLNSTQKGKIHLDPDDESLLIYQFPNEKYACEYLAFQNMDNVDVWINPDNKQMDNWLTLMDKARSGSSAANCVPHLTQLFVMGLGMFDEPLNVSTLIEWLNMPIHPINKYFRSILANCIVNEGGYRNEKCRKIVDKFIEGKFVFLDEKQKELTDDEQNAIRLKDRDEREKIVKVFLPSLTKPTQINTEDVRIFVKELAAWAQKTVHLLSEKEDNELWIEQLATVAEMCDTFLLLLETISTKTIEYKIIDSWMNAIYQKGEFTNAIAEKGCRTVISSPAKMASIAHRTIWIGVDGDASFRRECDFLYPSERELLTSHNGTSQLNEWNENEQNRYHELALQTPFRMTSEQLILVVRERVGGDAPLKHPFIVRLEQQIENLSDFIRKPKIEYKSFKEIKQQNTENKEDTIETEEDKEQEVGVIHFKHSDKIKWPDHLSPTSIATLAEYPFDYLLENLIGITPEGQAEMSSIKATSGNVAHAVIEKLFAPREPDTLSTPAQIADRINKEYEIAYSEVLEAKGALLQLTKNRMTEQLLHEQLRTCVSTLLEIITENKLCVTDCEHYTETRMNLGLPKALDQDGNEKSRDMLGYIDMTLQSEDGTPVIFDFKWTTWRNGYQDKLKENRSTQLELYRMMLASETKKEVKRVAYFLMPAAHLYSKEKFEGQHCTQIKAQNMDDIVEQLKQSAIYRKQQIDSGVVETNGFFNELQYVKDTPSRNLYPLQSTDDGELKADNHFSDYGFLLEKEQ